jgi:hypothetical protein
MIIERRGSLAVKKLSFVRVSSRSGAPADHVWQRCAIVRSCAYPAVCGVSLALCGAALGDTLSSESSIGLQSAYNSNPFMAPAGARGAESIAVLANLPATYTSDFQSFDLVPRVRFAETRGVEALLSNYQYLDALWHLTSERNTFSASADWHHDSTFYNAFENAVLLGRSLRRREEIANLDWKRALSERSDLHVSVSWDKVDYSQSAATGLQNYSYGQGMVQYDHELSERWLWTSSVGFAHFELPDGSERSDNRFAQTALKVALSEKWSLTAQVGYAYLTAHEQGSICCEILVGPNGFYLQPILVAQSASRGAGSYALSFERKGERWVVDLAASRAIQPSGLGALLTQDDASLTASIPWTERWTLTAKLHGAQLSEPISQFAAIHERFADFDLGANWLWTEHWSLNLQGSYNLQRVTAGARTASGVAVNLTLSRQFGRVRL